MENTKQLKATVFLSEPTNFAGADSEKPNVETHYLDGKAYTIQYGVPVEVPLELAKHMVDSGAIKSYKLVK